MLDSALNKLQGFGYPSELCDVISRFSEYVYHFFSNEDTGILLVGSAARGELSWAKQSDALRLFSDLEFFIAVSKKNKYKEEVFFQKILELESEYDFGELFHIDYTIIPWDKLERVDRKFIVYESKQCGIELGEKSVSECLPDVNLQNINWKELNEILLHRMNSILHAMPSQFLESNMSEGEELTFALNIAKNALDITTWLHPYEEKHLVAGFGARTTDWGSEKFCELKLAKYFSKGDIEYLEKCLALRKAPSFPVEVTNMLENTLILYEKGISYCKEMNSINDDADIGAFSTSAKLFDEYRFRQRAAQLIAMLKNANILGFLNVVRNSIGVKKGASVSFCYYMLLAAKGHANTDSMGWSHLEKARIELSRLDCRTGELAEDFVVAWSSMRDRYKKFQHCCL